MKMNILLVNPKFPLSFYSLGELFSGRGKKTTNPPLGLLTVAALLPSHWNIRLVDENVRDVTQEDYDFADSVWIGAMLPQKDSAIALVRAAKSLRKHVVAGGPFVSSLPEDMLAAGCDVLVRGEIEYIIHKVIEAVEACWNGVVIEDDIRPDLRNSPVPRFDLVNIDNYLAMSIQTSRGCPHNCEFCDVINLNGRIPRNKDPEQIIAELDSLFNLGWRGSVLICDDNFIGNKDYTRRLLQHIIPWSKEHGEPFQFTAQASIELARDKGLIDLMTEANIGEVFIGIETPDEDTLKRNNKSQNITHPLAESLRYINQNGISLQCSFIIGFDGEKPGAGERIVAFAETVGLPQVMLNMLVALPGTMLWNRLSKAGRIHPFLNIQDYLYGLETNFASDRPFTQIVNEYLHATMQLYSPEKYMRRAFDHIMEMRPTRVAMAHASSKPFPVAIRQVRAKGQGRNDMKMFLLFLWQHGIAASYRREFWKQFITIIRKNPSRVHAYVAQCIKCDIYAKFTRMMQARAAELGFPLPGKSTA